VRQTAFRSSGSACSSACSRCDIVLQGCRSRSVDTFQAVAGDQISRTHHVGEVIIDLVRCRPVDFPFQGCRNPARSERCALAFHWLLRVVFLRPTRSIPCSASRRVEPTKHVVEEVAQRAFLVVVFRAFQRMGSRCRAGKVALSTFEQDQRRLISP